MWICAVLDLAVVVVAFISPSVFTSVSSPDLLLSPLIAGTVSCSVVVIFVVVTVVGVVVGVVVGGLVVGGFSQHMSLHLEHP